MAKEKKQKQINLEEITALTKELFHAHYAGDLERWFDYLCPDSIYLGTGEPMLFGGSAIREHFKGFEGRAVDVVSEEYYPVPLGETAAQVCGQIAVKSRQNQLGAVNCFTIGWRLIGGELKMVHQHNSYEYLIYDISRVKAGRERRAEEIPRISHILSELRDAFNQAGKISGDQHIVRERSVFG